MADKSFVHLHSHAQGSTLDGLTKVKEMIEVAKEEGMPGIALTDHGNMSATYDLYKASKDSGVKPIFGIEAYLAPQVSRLHKEPVRWNPGGDDDVSGNGSYTHMTLLAKTDEGLHNLMKMSSEAFLSGYYYKPRMDDELLSQYGKGVIGTSGCVSGEIQTLIRIGRYEDAKASAMKFQDIFGKGNFFIELMDHGLDIERRGLKDLIRLAKELRIPMVATNDLHYARKSDADTHEALLAIGTGSTLDDPTRFKFDSKEFYIKSAREMRAIWDSEVPEACDNTLLICESIDATFHEGKDLMPKFDVPAGETEDSWLRKEVYAGLSKKFPEGIPLEYKERAEHELGVISQLGFASYFLVTADFIAWSRENGIRVGPGRGCLSGDTMVATPLGFRNIKELKIGDEVFDEIGNFVAITNTMTYQCDEPLINIKTFYGTREGESMTSDHKVLVSKANKETDKKLLRHGHKFKKEPASPQWIRADQVELGDLLVRPKLQVKIDANPFIVKNPEYFRPSNTEGIRTIAKLAGVSRSVVNKYKDGTSITIDRPATLRLKDWVSQNTSELMAPRFGYRTTIVNKVLPKTYDLGKLLGFWISDGWICSDMGKNLVGFCCRRSEDDNEIPNLISKVLGITDIGIANHPLKDLRQFNISHKGLRDWILEIFPDYKSTSGTKYIPEALLNTPEEFRRGLLEGLWAGDGSHSGKSKYATVSKRLAYNVQYLLLTLGLPASLNTSIRKEKRADRRNYTWIEYSIVSVHNFGKIKVQNGSDYDGKFIYSRVREINLKEPEGFVYDITVPTTQSYVTNNFVVHNSSAGSIIAYALSIVQVDPIRFGLLFERFLNIARATGEDASPPDIDIDFQPEGRERVIEYITQKYGAEKVASISTSMQLKGKSSIKDSARVLGATYGLGDKINKLYPKPIVGRDLSLADLYDPENERYDDGTELRTLVASDSEALKVVELAKALEGTKRGFGMHAAGIILSRESITDTVPVMKRDATSAVMTQFEYPVAEKLGLIKFDFLGLSNLSTISECLRLIKKNKGIEVDLNYIGEMINDTKTFRLLARGDTLGVFQLDSGPMRSLLRLMAVDSFDDISAVLALYRPGPMSQGSDILFADRKNGRKKIIPIHPELKESLNEVLGKTYGLCVTGDTLIWDAKSGSRVRIDSLEERIISGRFKTFGVNKEGKVEAFKVINWFNTGKKKTLAVKTRSGGEIKLSKDHQVLTPRGWIKAGELEPGVDRMAIPRSIFDKSSTKDGMSKEKARFLGYMLGDGYINLYQNTFINSNIAFLEEVARLSESIFPDVYPVLSDRRKEVRTLVGKNGQVTHPLMASSICFMATPRGFGKGKRIGNVHGGRYDRLSLNVWLKELGYDLNTRSNTKFVPEQIFASSNEVISEFIAGLWDTDGHVNNRFATLKTISKRLAYDTQALLQRLGIFSTIYETETYKSLKGDRIAYQVTIGEPVFWDIIVSRLFLSEKRVEHRGALQASYTQGLNGKLMLEKMFPLISEDEELPHWVRKRIKARGLVAIKAVRNYFARKYEVSLSTTLPTLSKDLHYMPAGELGQLYLEKLGDPEDLFYANQHWTLVDEVAESGFEDMYDITVDDAHNFIANGFVVHNCIYQEQVMQIAQKVAGYSLVKADLLRRAMGKKKKSILDKEFEGFSKGMKDNGYSDDCIQTLWDVLLPFADYAFNLSHSVAYAMVAYWTAYLKANFPVEYMAALLSTNADDKDKSAIYLAECRRMGIRVLNPDVNLSESLYSAVGEDIRVGLSAIKGVGEKSVEAWIVSRDERGPAKSFSDFLENGDSAICKKNVVAALIKSGAFDSFGKTRASLDAIHVEAVERAAAMKKSKGKMKKGQEQDSLFGPDDSAMFSVMIPEVAEWDQQLLLSYEKDMLGLYVSGHPLADLTDAILNWQEVSIADLKEGARSGSTVKIAGLVTSFERKVTKKGDPWALITLEDLDANIVVYCFPRTYNAAADILKSDAIVIISGKSEPRDDGSVAFMASSITAPNLSKVTRSDPQLWMDRQVVVQDELSDGTPVAKPKGDPEDNRQINIKVLESDLTPENVERLKVALVDHPGYRPVTVLISDEDGNSLGTMELEYKVYGSADLGAKIRYLFGSSAV